MNAHPDAAAAMKLASEDAQLDDFGDDRFIDPLSRYFEALGAEAHLTPVGQAVTAYDVRQLLVNRLRFEHDLKQYPAILDEQIASPLIILGLPRTGTTKIQQFLGADPSIQKIPYYLILNPAPLPGWTYGEPDPRISIAEQTVQAMAAQSPNFLVAHPPQATQPEEEAFFMRMTFEWCLNGILDRVPSHLAWLMSLPQEYNYGYLYRLLQYVQWQHGSAQDRPWLLKSPLHSVNLDVLVRTFPDATIVHCHRDPCEVIPSILRLNQIIWEERGSQADSAAVKSLFFGFWQDQMRAYLTHRERLGDRVRILDIQYTDILQDPLAVAHQVYEAWGRSLPPQTEQNMIGWSNENPQYKFGRHTYSLEDFGLDREQVKKAFAPYLERFAVRPAPSAG